MCCFCPNLIPIQVVKCSCEYFKRIFFGTLNFSRCIFVYFNIFRLYIFCAMLLIHLLNRAAPCCKRPYRFRNSSCSRANMNGVIRRSIREAKPSISNCGQSPWQSQTFFVCFLEIVLFKNTSIFSGWRHSPTNLIRPELRSSGSSACTFFTDIWTNELMCSMPTTLPLGPVCNQQNTDKWVFHAIIFVQLKGCKVYMNVPFLQSRR